MEETLTEFIDEVLDIIYLNGTKEDGKYCLTLHQAEKVAKQIYEGFIKNRRGD